MFKNYDHNFPCKMEHAVHKSCRFGCIDHDEQLAKMAGCIADEASTSTI
jgi:hypothetical protein